MESAQDVGVDRRAEERDQRAQVDVVHP
jgi:hypothetical protein